MAQTTAGYLGLPDAGNTFTEVVAAGGTSVSGAFTDVTDYGVIDVLATETVANPGRLLVDWSDDGATIRLTEEFVPASLTTISPTNTWQLSIPTFMQYYRLRFVNDGGSANTYSVYSILRPPRVARDRLGYIDGQSLIVMFADSAAAGNLGLIAPVTNWRVAVVGYQITVGATATSFFFRNSGGGAQLSMTHRVGVNGFVSALAIRGGFLFVTGLGLGLDINSSAANNFGVQVQCVRI